ncbi:MAG: ABC transporter permease [Anaerolineaceae bacterium]
MASMDKAETSDAILAKEKSGVRNKILKIFFDNFVWLLVIGLFIVAFFTTPSFFSSANVSNLLIQSVVLALLVVAESVCLITGYFDMSIESILIFTAVFASWLVAPHPAASGLELNGYLGIALILLTGAIIGAINGFLIAYLKMNAFIATLSMSIILIGSCVTISKGSTLGPLPEVFRFLGRGNVGPIPASIITMVVVYLIFIVIFKFTPYGRKLYSVGGNPNAAQASGVNVKWIVFTAYLLSGLISALGGLVLAGRMGAAVSHMTRNNLLYAFAAAVIGGVSPFGGQGKMISIFGGVILLVSINKLLIIADVDPFLITAVSGIIIFVAMLILTIKQKLVLED